METNTVQVPKEMLREMNEAHEKIDRILETLEVLMDADTLKRLKKGEEELKAGNYIDAKAEGLEKILG